MELSLISFVLGARSGLRLNPAELHARQLQRLRRLLDHSYENVPYYRKLFDSIGFRPRHLKRLSDLSAIPITRREHLQRTPAAELVARDAPWARLERSETSGSTGAPLRLYRTRSERWFRLLLTLRAFVHNGLTWNDRILTISRSPSTPARSIGLPRQLYCRWWNVSFFDSTAKQLQTLLEFAPTVVYGYAPSVALLADLASKAGTGKVAVRLAATSAEALLPSYKNAIQKGFGVDPLDVYSCTEAGDIAWQCLRKSGFHMNSDWLHVEIVRHDRSALPDEVGEVVLTSLYRYAMPLIRYSPGDFASLVGQPCGCGVGLPLLGRLEGRAQTLVPLPKGRYFIGFSRIMSDFPEVAHYQIVQRALDHFILSVVPVAKIGGDRLAQMAAALAAKMGEDVRVEIKTVAENELIKTPGKFRPVIPLAAVDLGLSR